MKIPKELQDKVRKYSLMVAWWQLHEEDENMEDKLREVLEKIGETEHELITSGVKTEILEKILKRAEQFVTTPIEEMSHKQFETLTKLIFGQKTEVEPFDKRELRKKGIIVFDPIKYAKWTKGKKDDTEYIMYEHKKPLWQGKKVSIRSCAVEGALRKKMGINVKYSGRTMSLTPNKLREEGVHNKTNMHTAKHSNEDIHAGEKYYLIDYVFNPN